MCGLNFHYNLVFLYIKKWNYGRFSRPCQSMWIRKLYARFHKGFRASTLLMLSQRRLRLFFSSPVNADIVCSCRAGLCIYRVKSYLNVIRTWNIWVNYKACSADLAEAKKSPRIRMLMFLSGNRFYLMSHIFLYISYIMSLYFFFSA